MKAKMSPEGTITVIAENDVEAFALMKWSLDFNFEANNNNMNESCNFVTDYGSYRKTSMAGPRND